MSDSNAPAGWYPDGSGGHRWWDGVRWTEHTQGGEVTQPVQAVTSEPVDEAVDPAQPGADAASGMTTGEDDAAGQGTGPSLMKTPDASPGGTYAAPVPAEPGLGEVAAPGQPMGPTYEHLGPSGYAGLPPAGEAPAAPRRKLPFVIAGGVAVLVVIALVVAFLFAGNGRIGGDDPEAVVDTAFDAVKAGDCEAFTATLTENSRARDTFNCDVFKQIGTLADSLKVTVSDSKVDGDKATVDATQSIEALGQSRTLSCTYVLLKQDGDWLIDDADCTDGS